MLLLVILEKFLSVGTLLGSWWGVVEDKLLTRKKVRFLGIVFLLF